MPPGPVFNWLCVASSAADILVRAARIRATQLAAGAVVTQNLPGNVQPEPPHPVALQRDENVADAAQPVAATGFEAFDASPELDEVPALPAPTENNTNGIPEAAMAPELHNSEMKTDVKVAVRTTAPESPQDDIPVISRQLQASKVPSSRIGRLFHYGGLAASLSYGAASELVRRTTAAKSDAPEQSLMFTEANIARLVSKLSQMRGAALKLGQFLSIQDTHVLPPEIDAIFRRVQDSANYMPDWQMEQVMQVALGDAWQDSFELFERVPFAAASIGQVHTATLAANTSPTGAPARVAVKIQFPNIAKSIASDLGYVSMLLTAGRMLPKGLFLDRTMAVMKEELRDECDYAREAGAIRRFGECLRGDERFRVPWVWEGSTDRVLVMERVEGVSVGDESVRKLSQDDRNEIASRIIELCLLELFSFRLMQTDPNYSNFLWDTRSRRLSLIDFGATREYGSQFMDGWLRLLEAAAAADRDLCIEESRKIGYLTGEENEIMLNAHTESLILLATPFAPRTVTKQPFAFGPGTQWAEVTQKIRAHIPVMIQNRLTPPPRETYSLNRKLSGAFLLATRLGATVDTRAIWDKVVSGYQFAS